MNAIKRHIALLMGIGLVVTGVWSCVATRKGDGWEFRFAPDMAITAYGLEDALGKLRGLLGSCISGTFGRPCTDGERADILEAMDKVLNRKDRMGDPPGPLGA